jgi:hypothetical protein
VVVLLQIYKVRTAITIAPKLPTNGVMRSPEALEAVAAAAVPVAVELPETEAISLSVFDYHLLDFNFKLTSNSSL